MLIVLSDDVICDIAIYAGDTTSILDRNLIFGNN